MMRPALLPVLALLGLGLAPARGEHEAPPQVGWVMGAAQVSRPDAALNQWADYGVWAVDPRTRVAEKILTLPGTEYVGSALGAWWFFSPPRLVEGRPVAVLWAWHLDTVVLSAHDVLLPGDRPLRPGASGESLLCPCGFIAEENGQAVWYAALPAAGAVEEWPGCRAEIKADGNVSVAEWLVGAPRSLPTIEGVDAASNEPGQLATDRGFRFSAQLDKDGRLREVMCHSLFKIDPKACRLPVPCDLSGYSRRDAGLSVWAYASDLRNGAPTLVLAVGRHPGDDPAKDDVRPLGYHLWSSEEQAWTRVDASAIQDGDFLDYPYQIYALDGRFVLELPPVAGGKPGATRYRLLDASGSLGRPVDLDAHLHPVRATAHGLVFVEGDEVVYRKRGIDKEAVATLPTALHRVQIAFGAADVHALRAEQVLAGVSISRRKDVTWSWVEKPRR